MSVTAFDIIAGLIVLVSGLTGFVRGAVREMLTVAAFLLAAAIAVFGLRFSGPLFRGLMDPDWLANTLAVLCVFTVLYLLLRLVGGMATRELHSYQTLGLIDRLIGVGFGLLRAFVILGLFNLMLMAAMMGRPAPAWAANARLFPVSQAAAHVVRIFAPKGSQLAGAVTRAAGKAVSEGSRDNENRRGSVEELIQKTP